MRLRLLVSSLHPLCANASEIAKALDSIGIKTSFDLLFSEPVESLYHRMPIGTISYPELVNFREQVAVVTAAQGESGVDAFEQELKVDNARFGGETGIKELDEVVGNAFGSYGVTELSGVLTTQLTLWVVLRHLASTDDASALWIDTMGEFAVNQAALALQQLEGKGNATALERLQISRCHGLTAVHDTLDALRATLDSLDKQSNGGPSPIRFAIISPLNALFTQLLTGSVSQGHAILTTFMRQLASLARTYRLTILIINTPVTSLPHNPLSAFSSTITKPGLGPTFTYLCDHTLWISNADDVFGEEHEVGDDAQVFLAEVFRSRTMPSRTWCPFVIRGSAWLEPFKPR